MDTVDKITIGQWVQTMREYAGVPKYTQGMIVEDYGTGMTVAWDLPTRRIPIGITPEQIAVLPATNHICPLRDGFDKVTELPTLLIIQGKHFYN